MSVHDFILTVRTLKFLRIVATITFTSIIANLKPGRKIYKNTTVDTYRPIQFLLPKLKGMYEQRCLFATSSERNRPGSNFPDLCVVLLEKR